MLFSSRRVALLACCLLLVSGAVSAATFRTRSDSRASIQRQSDGSLILRNASLVAVLEKSGTGFSRLVLYPASRPTHPNSEPVAEIAPLARVAWFDGATPKTADFVPTEARISGNDRVRLSGEVATGGSPTRVEATLSLSDDRPWIDWSISARSTSALAGLAVTGLNPRLPAHDDSNVLAPGLAVEDNPDPAHEAAPADVLTIPLLAAQVHGATVATLWNPSHTDATLVRQRIARDETGVMELFVASAGDTQGRRQVATLSGKLVVEPETDSALSAVRAWFRAYGTPASKAPRSLEQARHLAREAILVSKHPLTEPGTIALSAEAEDRRDVKSRAESLLSERRKAAELSTAIAYRDANSPQDLISAVSAARRRVEALFDQQLASGAWPAKRPGGGSADPEDVAADARLALEEAATTGNTAAAGSGIKALDYLTSLDLDETRAPLLEPLIALIEAYFLGYQISGEDRFLREARRWADAGLPFVYLWRPSDRPSQAFAAIAETVPAATTATASPVAVPAIGLRYARVLRSLSRYRPDSLYDAVEAGIVDAAVRMQYAAGENRGKLPERWSLRDEGPEGAAVSPEPLLSAIFSREGYETDLVHRRVRVGPDRLFVTTGAGIRDTETTSTRLRLNMRWVEDAETWTTITGVPAAPVAVEFNTDRLRRQGLPLRPRTFLKETDHENLPGWRYDPEAGLLLLRIRHTGKTDRIEIRFPDPIERDPVQRVDTELRRSP